MLVNNPDEKMSIESLTKSTNPREADELLLGRANEIADLLKKAIKLGYSICFTPEQMKVVVQICEEARLIHNVHQK